MTQVQSCCIITLNSVRPLKSLSTTTILKGVYYRSVKYMKVVFPSVFSFEEEDVKLIYLKGSDVPFYNATTVAKALKLKSPASSAISAVSALCEKVKDYCALSGKEFITGKRVEIANSVRNAEILASDGVIVVLRVWSSKRMTNSKFNYYYNQEALFEILLNSNAEGALRFRYWVTHDVLPAIAKYGEYVGVRKDGIDLRRCLTDSIKRRIDAKELDEKAYATVTDVVYLIRYGFHTNTARKVWGLAPDANLREALSQDELRVLGELENKVAGLVDIGMDLGDIATNERLIKIYRKVP